jgi:hypothetical protein
VLPTETFETIERLLTLSLAKPKSNAEAIMKTQELVIFED